MGDVRLAKTPSRWARYLTTGFEQRGSSRATDLSRCLCHRTYVILVEASTLASLQAYVVAQRASRAFRSRS